MCRDFVVECTLCNPCYVPPEPVIEDMQQAYELPSYPPAPPPDPCCYFREFACYTIPTGTLWVSIFWIIIWGVILVYNVLVVVGNVPSVHCGPPTAAVWANDAFSGIAVFDVIYSVAHLLFGNFLFAAWCLSRYELMLPWIIFSSLSVAVEFVRPIVWMAALGLNPFYVAYVCFPILTLYALGVVINHYRRLIGSSPALDPIEPWDCRCTCHMQPRVQANISPAHATHHPHTGAAVYNAPVRTPTNQLPI